MGFDLIIIIVAVVAVSLGFIAGKQRRFSFKILVMALLVIALILAFAGVQPLAGYKSVAIANITNIFNEQVMKAEERTVQERIKELTIEITVVDVKDPPGTDSLLFKVLLEPSGVDAVICGKMYVVALVSKDGHLFSAETVTWQASAFQTPPDTERNIEVIRRAEQQRKCSVQLSAPKMDKDIYPLFCELMDTEAYKNIYRMTKVVKKHVTITCMTMQEWTEWYAGKAD